MLKGGGGNSYLFHGKIFFLCYKSSKQGFLPAEPKKNLILTENEKKWICIIMKVKMLQLKCNKAS